MFNSRRSGIIALSAATAQESTRKPYDGGRSAAMVREHQKGFWFYIYTYFTPSNHPTAMQHQQQ